jgi:hypothetical protein
MAETATDVREQAQEKAQQAKSKASDQARTQVDQRSTELGERVNSTAGDIRTVSQQLREQGKDQPAKLADQAAGHVERIGGWLRDSDSDKLLSDVEDFGRRQPWVLAVGGLALGFAAARFLKASSTQRYERRQSEGFGTVASGNGQASFEATSPGLPAGSAETPTGPGLPETRTGVPAVSPAETTRTLGTTPPPPSGGTKGR